MDKLKVDELKKKLRERGASTRGRKGELIERLEAYQRNDNFQNDPVLLPAVYIPEWPESGYKQLCLDHKDELPHVHKCHIEHYFIHRQVADTCSNDIKSLEKGKDLLSGGKVEACSFVLVADNFFFTGVVRAAMKKKVSYSYKLKVENSGEVLNSHCECPAGKGPHGTCKHIAAVCFMLEQFKEEGTLKIGMSCTETLQVFHQPVKRHTGSPVKAEELKIPSHEYTNLDDPRPLKFRRMEGYTDYVSNMVTNYCAYRNENLAIRYTFERADIQTAMKDHNYLERPFLEYWVDNSNKVTDREAFVIEEATREQNKSVRWHEERRWRLTASNFGVVCKLSARRNIDKLCKNLYITRHINSKAISHGNHYEKIAKEKFMDVTGLQVKKCGLFISVNYPFIAATPDGLIANDSIVEIKCPYTGRNEPIQVGAHFPYIYMQDTILALKTTHRYYDQIQGQLYITRRRYCYFVIYTFVDIKIINVPINFDYCISSLVPKLKSFYSKHYKPFIVKQLYN